MSAPILVTGATGRLGQLIVARLVSKNQHVRVFTRRPGHARALFGTSVEVASGDFADPVSVRAAVRGINRLLLLSPLSGTLSIDQIGVAEAATAAGATRIVKSSGSDWTIDPPGLSISGDAHAAVEWRLRGLPIEHVSLRPNAWMQVALPNLIRQAETGQMLSAGYGGAGIAFIDARDIADVAVHQLLARDIASKPAILSGPAIVDLREIAGILARLLHRPVAVADAAVTPIIAADASFEHRAVAQFKGLIAAGRAAYATEAVSDILGRAPRSVEQFLTEHLTAACFAEPRTGARS
jgi:uncharacterized protein YbjT (DUF2867 family)